MSAQEEAVLLLAANDQGVTPVRFLVESALAMARAGDADGLPETPTSRHRRVEALYAARHALAEVAVQARRVGVNVNQVAKAANQGQPVPVDAMRAYLVDERSFLARSREIAEHIDDLIDELAAQGVGS